MTSRNVVVNLIEDLLKEKAASGEEFTACGLRDTLLKHPDLSRLDPKKLYWRVRDRLYRLEEAGVALRVGTEGARRPVYRLAPASHFSAHVKSSASGPAENTAGIARQLKKDGEKLQADMQRSLGRLEEYKNLVTTYPWLREQLKPLQQKEMEHAQRLNGRLQGQLKVRALLSGESEVTS